TPVAPPTASGWLCVFHEDSDAASERSPSARARRSPMSDVKQMIEAGRQLLREKPGLTEAEFRNIMLERFRAHDQGLQDDKRNMTSGPADPVSGVFSIFALPWAFFRWIGWRTRLARHRAEMDEVVGALRREGQLADRPAQ